MDGSVSLANGCNDTTVTDEELAGPVADIAAALQGERLVLDAT